MLLDIQVHQTILLQILKDIYTDIQIAPILGFKGGTACFFFYELSRFSLDLDFDLLDAKKAGAVFNKVGNILLHYGDIRDKMIKRNTLFYLLSYQKGVNNIKVEISRRNFGSRYEIKNYLGISMLVMKREDMFANKLVALSERKQLAHRDLYDLWFFLKNRWEINQEIVKKRTNMRLKEYLGVVIELVESVDNKRILHGLGELLDEERKAFMKKTFKQELLFLLKLRLRQTQSLD